MTTSPKAQGPAQRRMTVVPVMYRDAANNKERTPERGGARDTDSGRAALAIAAVRHDMVAAILTVTGPSPYFAHAELERELRPLMQRLEQVAQRGPELMGPLGAHFGATGGLGPLQQAVTARAEGLLERRLISVACHGDGTTRGASSWTMATLPRRGALHPAYTVRLA